MRHVVKSMFLLETTAVWLAGLSCYSSSLGVKVKVFGLAKCEKHGKRWKLLNAFALAEGSEFLVAKLAQGLSDLVSIAVIISVRSIETLEHHYA